MPTAIPLRILLVNEPRAYREALGAALGVLRPDARVRVAEPGQLEAVLQQDAPHLVVCSRRTPPPEPAPLGWVVLYPDGAPHAELRLEGQRSISSAVQLEDLLALVERAARLVQPG
jgi:hypothetical protein